MEPFISVEDLNAFMEGTLTGGELLTSIALDGGCQMVRDELKQTVNLVRDDIETHDGSGAEGLLLNELPVLEVTLVTEDDVDLTEGTDYVVVPGTGILWRKGGVTWPFHWSRGRQNIEVTYDHGYAISEDDVEDLSEPAVDVDRVPSSIRLAALEAAARVVRAPSLAAVASGITGETLGAYSYSASLGAMQQVIAGGLLPEEKITLARWKPGGATG
jgi:hypothetical protein